MADGVAATARLGRAKAAVPAPAARPRRRSGVLLRRIIASFVIAPPVLLGVYAGGAWFLLGTGIVTYLALREFYALSARPGARLVQPLGFLLAFGVLLANGGRDLVVGALGGPSAIPAAQTIAGWALTLAGTLYVAWLMSHFQTLRLLGGPDGDAGRGWVFYTLAATWSFDSGAYLVGSRIGRHRFMTWISPRKTWEGAAGGLLLCFAMTLIARSELPLIGAPLAAYLGWAPLPIPLWQVPFLAVALACAAQLGDLAESMIKREAGAKDASELIPGHGGMLDRVDSLLFTVVLVYYYAAAIAL